MPISSIEKVGQIFSMGNIEWERAYKKQRKKRPVLWVSFFFFHLII